MLKKPISLFILVLTVIIFIAGCNSKSSQPAPSGEAAAQTSSSPQQQSADPQKDLYEKAKKEGEVIFWGPLKTTDVQPLIEAFNKKFPGIKVNHTQRSNEEFVTQAIAEAKSGKVSYDISEGKMSANAPLLDRDLIQSYDDWSKIFSNLNAKAISENGKLLTWYNFIFPIAYNSKILKPEDLPKSWDDLLDPKWKGKIIVEPRGNAFSFLAQEWGEQKLNDYLAKLVAQQPIFVAGGYNVSQQLAAGIAPLAIGTYDFIVEQDKAKGAPVEWIKTVGPMGMTNTSLYVRKDAPHPNAAKLLVGWLASDEAQAIFYKTSFNGPKYLGSSNPIAFELQKNNVKVILEDGKNYKQIESFNAPVAKALLKVK